MQSPTGPGKTKVLKIKLNNSGQEHAWLTQVAAVASPKLPKINKVKQRRARTSMANVSCRSSKPHTAPVIQSIAS